jgi:hypothetical protein
MLCPASACASKWAGLGDPADEFPDVADRVLGAEGIDRHVAVVDRRQDAEGIDAHVLVRTRHAAPGAAPREVPLRDADRLGPVGGAAHADPEVERCAEDGDVDPAGPEILGIERDRQAEERRDAEPRGPARLAVRPERAGLAPRVARRVTRRPEPEAGIAGIPQLRMHLPRELARDLDDVAWRGLGRLAPARLPPA